MHRDFQQIEWETQLEDDCRQIVRLAVREDLERKHDWTTVALVPSEARASAAIVARGDGTIAGLRAAELALAEMDAAVSWTPHALDGDAVVAGDSLAIIQGPARSLLTAERTLLNLLGHLSGIASLTRRYVDAVAGTGAGVYDTRKTTPAWRRLEKYAVRCGGGRNHRTGLFDAILIKDNHLAFGAAEDGGDRYTPSGAVRRARDFICSLEPADSGSVMLIEVEVDTLEQLEDVLPANPDIILLDNMTLEAMKAAVALRNRLNPAVELDASGGVNLHTVAEIARTGVERISIGALTHSAVWFDVAMDWI